MKKICLLLVLTALAACQPKQEAPAPKPAAPVKAAPAKPVPAKPAPAKISDPARNLSINPPKITADNSFGDSKSCVKKGFSEEQCAQAFTVAAAMHNADAPKLATEEACKAIFQTCVATADKKFSPKLEGFTVAGQEKGKVSVPSAEKPLYFVPLYKDAKGTWGKISLIKGQPSFVPLGQ